MSKLHTCWIEEHPRRDRYVRVSFGCSNKQDVCVSTIVLASDIVVRHITCIDDGTQYYAVFAGSTFACVDEIRTRMHILLTDALTRPLPTF